MDLLRKLLNQVTNLQGFFRFERLLYPKVYFGASDFKEALQLKIDFKRKMLV